MTTNRRPFLEGDYVIDVLNRRGRVHKIGLAETDEEWIAQQTPPITDEERTQRWLHVLTENGGSIVWPESRFSLTTPFKLNHRYESEYLHWRCPECDTYSGTYTQDEEVDEVVHSLCGRAGSANVFIPGTPENTAVYEGESYEFPDFDDIPDEDDEDQGPFRLEFADEAYEYMLDQIIQWADKGLTVTIPDGREVSLVGTSVGDEEGPFTTSQLDLLFKVWVNSTTTSDTVESIPVIKDGMFVLRSLKLS